MRDDSSRQTRRKFLATASASALVMAAHRHIAWAAPLLDESHSPARIVSLRLRTAAPLEKMKEFYGKTLGLPVLAEGSSEITIGGGATPITFVKARPEHGAPFYHFAFNIPQNKIRGAREWQLERTELLPVFPRLRDERYPDDVVHFRNWNAHSVFFLDPAENIVEYIARHDLKNDADGSFTKKDILHASEIAFVVDDVSAMASGLQGAFNLSQYRTGGKSFRALGDEHGLLLVFERGRKLSLDYKVPKLADVFPTQVDIRSAAGQKYSTSNFPYEITRADAS